MKVLVDQSTRKRIKIGDEVVTYSGVKATVKNLFPPKNEDSTGEVEIRTASGHTPIYFPAVINAVFICEKETKTS